MCWLLRGVQLTVLSELSYQPGWFNRLCSTACVPAQREITVIFLGIILWFALSCNVNCGFTNNMWWCKCRLDGECEVVNVPCELVGISRSAVGMLVLWLERLFTFSLQTQKPSGKGYFINSVLLCPLV